MGPRATARVSTHPPNHPRPYNDYGGGSPGAFIVGAGVDVDAGWGPLRSPSNHSLRLFPTISAPTGIDSYTRKKPNTSSQPAHQSSSHPPVTSVVTTRSSRCILWLIATKYASSQTRFPAPLYSTLVCRHALAPARNRDSPAGSPGCWRLQARHHSRCYWQMLPARRSSAYPAPIV